MIKRVKSLPLVTQADFEAMGQAHALLLVDIDNTLLAPDQQRIDPQLKSWIETMKADHQILLCTNNFTKRQFKVSEDLDLPILMRSFKPLPWMVKSYLKRNKADVSSILVIGDQVITDIVLAIWMKRPYLLVKPLKRDLHFVTRCFRILESVVINDE